MNEQTALPIIDQVVKGIIPELRKFKDVDSEIREAHVNSSEKTDVWIFYKYGGQDRYFSFILEEKVVKYELDEEFVHLTINRLLSMIGKLYKN